MSSAAWLPPRHWRRALLCCLVLGLVSCAQRAAPLPEGAVALGDSGLWVSASQLRLMPAMAMGAAYFTVHNRSGQDDRLLNVRVLGGSALEASLHETELVEGISRMRSRPQGFPVPAGTDFSLAPGGAHVMLSGELPASGAEPATLQIRLQFERGGDHEVTLAALANP